MALRGTTSSYGTTSVTTGTITYSGASNIQANDLILLISSLQANGSTSTFTDPSGFTAGSSLSPSIPDVLVNSTYYHLAVKIATAADAGTPTYSTTSSVAGHWLTNLRVYSGRTHSSVAAAFSNSVVTAPQGSPSTFPISYALSGITCSGGDDLVAVILSDQEDGLSGATGISASISGFSNLLSTFYVSYQYTGFMWTLDAVNHASGATGSLTATLSDTGGSGTLGQPFGFLISLPQYLPYAQVNQLDYSQTAGSTPLNTASPAHGGGPTDSLNITAGNLGLAVIFGNSITMSTNNTITDSVGNSYTYLGQSNATGSSYLANCIGLFGCQSMVGGTGVTYTAGASNQVLYVAQYSGIAPVFTYGSTQGNAYNAPGTGTGVITTSAVTITLPSMFFGFCFCQSTGVTTPATATSGYNGHTPVWSVYNGSSTACALSEDQNVTSNTGASFDLSGNGGLVYYVVAAAFPYLNVALQQSPFSTTQFFVNDVFIQL